MTKMNCSSFITQNSCTDQLGRWVCRTTYSGRGVPTDLIVVDSSSQLVGAILAHHVGLVPKHLVLVTDGVLVPDH